MSHNPFPLLNRAARLVEAEADHIMTVAETRDPLVKKTIHALAARIRALQPVENDIHLQWPDDGAVLCGIVQPRRFWVRWTLNALNWYDVCPACVHVWTHPASNGEVHHG
jgi:hypothetical protein